MVAKSYRSWGQTTLLSCETTEVESYLGTPPYQRGTSGLLMVVLCSSARVQRIFELVREKSLESSNVKWFLVDEKNATQGLAFVLREESQVAVARRTSEGSFILLRSAVNADDSVRFETAGRGRNTREGFHYYLQKPLFRDLENYRDFQGRELKTSLVDNWPWFGLRQGPDGELLPDSGIDVSIINTLSQVLNFTYKVVVPEDGLWGGPQPDGSVVGLIGLVARHEAHIAINEITITEARKTVVEFTWPYFMESSTCVSRAPEERNRAFAVLSPFSLQVWVAVGLSVLGVTIVVFLFGKLTVKCKGPAGGALGLQELAFSVFRNLVVQGNLLFTDQWPLRCLFGAWYLYCYYVYAVYSGTLTAVLAIPDFEDPIDSLSDILERASEGFYPVVLRESSVEYIFEAYGSTSITSRFLPNHDGCRSCLTKSNKVLLRITEAGLIDKWRREQIIKLRQDGSSGGGGVRSSRASGPSALTITHLQGAFFLYVIGFFVSSFALVGEKIVRRVFA
ncbi:glutamate receptor ionotropic, delta-2-like [Penaeus vannamei]|uniref:glutamate receptor ionotropic, delta-2-like n=1 Tax=Penaeus vannamei TaxID=6689 RepID=UPI00387F970B